LKSLYYNAQSEKHQIVIIVLGVVVLRVICVAVWFDLVWSGLFVHPFSHTCKNGQVKFILTTLYLILACSIAM